MQEAVELKLTMSSSSIQSIEWSVRPAIDWQGNKGTWNGRKMLSIYENVLQPGTRYTISVQGELPSKRNACPLVRYTLSELSS